MNSFIARKQLFEITGIRNQIKSGYLRKLLIIMSAWIPAIGLEVHAPIRAAVKIFSGGLARTTYDAVNEAVAFFDLALPGSLPVSLIILRVA